MKIFIDLLETFQHLVFRMHSGGGGEGLGILGWVEEFLAHISEMNFSEQIEAQLSGMDTMMSLHNVLGYLPIVLLMCFLMVELLGILIKRDGFRDAASWLLYLGTITMIVTFLVAFFANKSAPQDVAYYEGFIRQQMFELGSMGLAIVLSVWRWISRVHFSRPSVILHVLLAIGLVSMVTLGRSI